VIAYSAAPAGVPDVIVRPFSPDSRSAASSAGAQWMVSSNGGLAPRWTGDGKRLYYVSLNGDVMAVDVSGGASFRYSAAQRLFGGAPLQGWSLNPAGDQFLVLRTGVAAGPPPPITLVLNWVTKLEQ
jgi:hypothetical protein